ncbi:DUF2637 domain-containing protein [Citricoccus nitrophenolicus]|uniref:DUF2637 domain-containing protein n=1 Tax=Citricoccus nitrophenolicus TaxID=863575 RepID=UPI0039B468D0
MNQSSLEPVIPSAAVATGDAVPEGMIQDAPAVTRRGRSTKRVNPDDARFIRFVVAGVIIAGLVAFAISFAALYQVAEWLGLPPFMWWAVPVFIDLALIVYSASVLVHKARAESTVASWAALGTFTALSVFANGAHAWAAPQDQAWHGIVGTVIAGMVPVAIFVATEQLSRVAVENPESRRAELREQVRMDKARVEHEQHMARLRFEQEQAQAQMEHEREMAARDAELDREEHRTQIEVIRARRELAVKTASTTDEQTPSSSPEPPQRSTDHARAASGPARTTSQLRAVPTPEQATPSGATKDSTEMARLATFVEEQTAAGVEVTASMVTEQFGKSDRTWRRHLARLRDKHPEVFEAPTAAHGPEGVEEVEDEREERQA